MNITLSRGEQGRYRQKRTFRWGLVFAHLYCIVLFISLTSSYRLVGMQDESPIYAASLSLIAVFAWSLYSWIRATKRLFDPYSIFLIAAMLFNGGHALLEVFALNQNGILNSKFAPDITFNTLFLITVGISAWHLGALISAAIESKGQFWASVGRGTISSSAQNARRVGWILLLISALPAILVVQDAIRVVLSSGYFALFQQETSTGLDAGPRVIAAFIVPSAMFLLAGSQGKKSVICISILIIIGYSLTQLFLGARYHAVMPIVAYAWLWHRCIRPLPVIPLLVAGLGILFFVLPLVAVIRNVSGAERLSLQFIAEAFLTLDNPAIAIIYELGNSMETVAYTLELVPAQRDFDMGVGYLYALLTVVPNLFWDVHPAIAHGTAANWLVWQVSPLAAKAGGGLGYSFIAEAYLNFGWIGTPIILGSFGFLYAKLIIWGHKSEDPAKLAMIACFTSFFVYLVRGETVSVTRALVWYSLGPYILAVFLTRSRSSRSVHPVTTGRPHRLTLDPTQPEAHG